MRVKEKEPRIYGAVFYDGINVNAVKKFVEDTGIETLIKNEHPGLPSFFIAGMGKIEPRSYIVRYGGQNIKVFSKEEFDKLYEKYDEDEIKGKDFKNYIAVSFVKAKLNNITNKFTIINESTGFQFEMNKDEFEKKFIPIEDFNRLL